jgi:hypothetical protein
MSKSLLLTAMLCLLGTGVILRGMANMPHTYTVVPSSSPPPDHSPNVCTGPSPDPQAATDGFTYAAYCIDFTQRTIPANWLACEKGNVPGYLLYASWQTGVGYGGNVSCANFTHEIDPLTGRYALHIHYDATASSCIDLACGFMSVNTGSGGVDCTDTTACPGNYFGQGWIEYTFRLATSPAAPAPQYITPGALTTGYGGLNNGTGGHIEVDNSEYDTWFVGGCWGANGTVNAGYLAQTSFPCPTDYFQGHGIQINPTQYQRSAIRMTGNGTTLGFTGYWSLDGQPLSSAYVGSYQIPYSVPQVGSKNGSWTFWNSPFHCGTSSPAARHPNGHCSNGSITNVYRCSDGNTCVTVSPALATAVNANTGTYKGCVSWYPVFIAGANGSITGLNGLHLGMCAVHGTNPDSDLELQDLPWPGGAYAGGGRWNPLDSSDLWIKNIQFWSCPGFAPTKNPPTLPAGNPYCNEPILAGAP